jgi:hypothetical protein
MGGGLDQLKIIQPRSTIKYHLILGDNPQRLLIEEKRGNKRGEGTF